jgi:hypothetical protein
MGEHRPKVETSPRTLVALSFNDFALFRGGDQSDFRDSYTHHGGKIPLLARASYPSVRGAPAVAVVATGPADVLPCAPSGGDQCQPTAERRA